MSQPSLPTIYCLPGRGGRLDAGLGLELLRRGHALAGRETVGAFARLPFAAQIDAIAADLHAEHWREDALVIANSYGAYLFLHAQARLAPFPGRVLLLSPVVGPVSSPGNGVRLSPPMGDLLLTRAGAGDLAVPRACEIHVGALDWQSPPALVSRLGRLAGIPVHVVPGNGHMLDKAYVAHLLDAWLAPPPGAGAF